MRQFLAILLSVFYLVLSTGAAINMHYCGGELESVRINSNPVSCCCGDMEMSNNCCQDEEFILDLNLDQQIVSFTNTIPENLFAIVYIAYGLDLIQNEKIEEIKIHSYNIPPPKPEPIWLINCTLTYYG